MKSFARNLEMFKVHALEMVSFWLILKSEGDSAEADAIEGDIHRFLKRNFLGHIFHHGGKAVFVGSSTASGKLEIADSHGS